VSVISPELLAMLRCPQTRQPLAVAAAPLVAAVNERIALGELRNQGGDCLEKPIDAALMRPDRVGVYPVVDGIPILLADEMIPLAQFPAELVGSPSAS
jgi:uncharacterized protein YbaR (Trm112 family)